MAAHIKPFTPRNEKRRRQRLAEACAILRELSDDLPPDLQSALSKLAPQITTPGQKWIFVMISPSQHNAVVQHMAAHSSRPLIALRLWATCLEYLDMNTGEIMRTRDELAAELGQTVNHISRIMSELAELGAIVRYREKTASGRHAGRVHYFLNPRVGTHLPAEFREAAQASAPPILTLVKS